MFEDNQVAWLLDYPSDVLQQLTTVVGGGGPLESRLREGAWAYFTQRSSRAKGYPRQYVFEAYQVAALHLLAKLPGEMGDHAQIILDERYRDLSGRKSAPPGGFPGPEAFLGTSTLFTELVKRPALREQLWPEEQQDDFRHTFRRREQRREMLSALLRLGAAYVDLYLIAIALVGSFDLEAEAQTESAVDPLIDGLLDRLERQSKEPGMHAFRELSRAADTFDILLANNFPDVRDAALHELATIYGRTLQRQSPVGRMAGTVNKRMIRQFRMPGYPLVLVTTDVLQEGEDLHTFCKRVIHYGITWTPSAMEQRTGRVDRIHSLVQRELDGRERSPDPTELIQVHYPHLADTVERLQVCRVMDRLNRFLQMVHEPIRSDPKSSSQIDVNRAVLRSHTPAPPIRGTLRSAFPVESGWTEGECGVSAIVRPDLKGLEKRFTALCGTVVKELGAITKRSTGARRLDGKVAIRNGRIVTDGSLGSAGVREQAFELRMRSQVVGEATLIRCISPVGHMDLTDDGVVDELYERQRDLSVARVCAHPGDRHHSMVTVENDRLFRLDTTQPEEIVELVRSVVLDADRIEASILRVDAHWDDGWDTDGDEGDER